MAREILSEAIWSRVEPCFPAVPHRRRVPGPHPLDNRSVLTGILFVLRSGLPWEELPAELGAGSGMTCLRRLRQWQEEGVWRRIRVALSEVMDPREIDWKRAEVRPRARSRRATRAGVEQRSGRDRAPGPPAAIGHFRADWESHVHALEARRPRRVS